MRSCSKLVLATFAAIFSTLAAAAGASAPVDPSAVTQTPAQHTKKEAKAVKNERMNRCGEMMGDEKAACQKQAKSDAKTVANEHQKNQGATAATKP